MLAAVVEAASINAGDVESRAVAGSEGRLIGDHQHVTAGRQILRGESKRNAPRELNIAQRNRLRADVLELDVFKVTVDVSSGRWIGRMIVDLGELQIILGLGSRD